MVTLEMITAARRGAAHSRNDLQPDRTFDEWANDDTSVAGERRRSRNSKGGALHNGQSPSKDGSSDGRKGH